MQLKIFEKELLSKNTKNGWSIKENLIKKVKLPSNSTFTSFKECFRRVRERIFQLPRGRKQKRKIISVPFNIDNPLSLTDYTPFSIVTDFKSDKPIFSHRRKVMVTSFTHQSEVPMLFFRSNTILAPLNFKKFLVNEKLFECVYWKIEKHVI